jgi:hypothetical protein
MPPSVKVSYKPKYADPEISARASAMGNVVGKVIDTIKSPTDFFSSQNMKNIGASVGEGVVAIAGFAGKAMADLSAPGAVALAQLSSGMILGSKMEVMFEGVGRREFSFSFNFIPKSEQEAIMVHDIVQTFKEHMLPEYMEMTVSKEKRVLATDFSPGTTQKAIKMGSGRVLRIPDTFDIQYYFHNNENPFLNRISTCYLTSMDVDYGGDKYVTYEPTKLGNREGPPPQRTAISLNFTEIEIITRERAKQGF